MKIRTQSYVLIAGIVLMPLLVVTIFFVYQRIDDLRMEADFRRAAQPMDIGHQETPEQAIERLTSHAPPGAALAISDRNQRIVYSNIPGLRVGSDFYRGAIDAMRRDRGEHLFLFSLPPGPNLSGFATLFRVDRRDFMPARVLNQTLFLALIALAAILCFAAAMAVVIVRSITRSVLKLDEATRRVASGELDTPISVEGGNEISSLAHSLEKMRQEIRDDVVRRSRFVMGISHDLKTPLALIRGYAEALDAGSDRNQEERKAHLSIIMDKADQLELMIDELIDHAVGDRGEWELTFGEFDLRDWLETFMNRIRADADLLGSSADADIDLPAGLLVHMDERMIVRAFENIVNNGLRYSGERGRLQLRAFEAPGAHVIEFADNGPGIAAEDLPHVFEPFYRGSASRREPGMGLGLSVVKNVIQAHGWSISVASPPGSGANFVVRIPIVPRSDPGRG